MRILRQVFRAWWQLLLIHLVYVVLGIVIFSPLLGLAGQLLLALSGEPALADQEIARFLLSPTGFLALVIFGALLISIVAIEQATMMNFAMHAIEGRTLEPLEALRHTLVRIRELYLFAIRLVLRLFALSLPFAALAAVIAAWLILEYDINYYLSERPPEFLAAVGLIGLVLVGMTTVLMYVLSGWIIGLPLVLFNGTPPARAFAESSRRLRGNRWPVVGGLIAWSLLVAAAGLLVLTAVGGLAEWIIPRDDIAIGTLLILLGGLSALWTGCNFFLTSLASGGFAFLVDGYYRRYGPGTDLEALDASHRHLAAGWPRLPRRALIAGLVLAPAAAVVTGFWLLDEIPLEDEVAIIAHRGASASAPENTLAAVQRAIEDRSDWVEIDVQESADGRVVVIHDSDFMKLAGVGARVHDTTYDEMQVIDIGSRFDPAFASERVPLLGDVLETVRNRARLVIELKYYGHEKDLEQRVIDIVESHRMSDQIAVMSLKYDAVRKMRALRPEWSVGLLSATAIGDLSKLEADFFAVASGMASAGFVQRVQESGGGVWVWTVNDAASMSRMMSLGVDGIITDRPDLARQVLEERQELNAVERLLISTAIRFGRPVQVAQ